MPRYLELHHLDIASSEFLRGVDQSRFCDLLSDVLISKVQAVLTRSNRRADGQVLDYDQGNSGKLSNENYSHYLCSSSLDIVCSGGWIDMVRVCQKIQSLLGVTSSFSNAMQCATWGYLVKQHLILKPYVNNIIISIVDANPLDIDFWDNNLSWGKSACRITHIHLKTVIASRMDAEKTEGGRQLRGSEEICALITPEGARQHLDEVRTVIDIGKCNPEGMLYDYAAAVYRAGDSCNGATVVVPYFDTQMRIGLQRILQYYPHLCDRYEEYGHVYGADPWISIARDAEEGCIDGKRFQISSLASEGYYCFLHARVGNGFHIGNFE